MQKGSTSESGVFRPRVLVALSLCFLGALLAMFSFATPTPPSGTLSTANRTITYSESDGGVIPNPSEVALNMPDCTVPMSCSTFLLTINPSVGTAATGYDPTQYQIFMEWRWAIPTVDYDIFVENAAGTAVIASNRSTADPSSITLPTTTPPGDYRIVLALATGPPIAYTATIPLQPKPAVSGLCDPSKVDCTPPHYQSYSAGPGQADGAGEPSLGVDWNPNVPGLKNTTPPTKLNTGGVSFFTAGSNEWRVNFDDCCSPAINLWENVSAVTTQTFVLSDPIGFVDHYTSNPLGLVYPPPQTPGRVFTIDLIGGQGDSLGSYSDNDGNSYLPGGNGGPGQGPDHETLGGGPYAGTPPATASYPATGTKNAIYYCSQNIVAEAQCSRSDDGGQTFGPGIAIFTPTQCTGGIHGHVKVARDGTVYVPNSSCGTTGNDGNAVSTDNGLTWTENNVPGSTGSQDPSVGIGQNNVGKPGTNLNGTNTIYLGWVSGDSHAHVAHAGDRGATWTGDTDVGAPFGVTHAVFPVVVAGDDNRAAFAFLGTGDGILAPGAVGTCGPYGTGQDANGHDSCANIWHLYIATTYDGGANWITVDATPNDPVQKGAICLQGTTCAAGRNLLDFNDFAIDSEGRGLVGYADGCVNCNNTFDRQSGLDHGTVTRQSGGRRLFTFFDPNPVEPVRPAAPQLISAVRGSGGVLVTWLEPDNGGSPIIGYNIYRSASSRTEVFLAGVSGVTNTKYLDTAAPAGNLFYYVQAVNAIGEGTHCREVSLSAPPPPPEDVCVPPGITVTTDPAGDEVAAQAGGTPEQDLDVQLLQISEPYTSGSDKSVTFTLKTASLASPLPPNATWFIRFNALDTTNVSRALLVEMDTNGAGPNPPPAFHIGRTDVIQGQSGDTTQSTLDSLISGSFTADGTITIKLKIQTPMAMTATGAPNFTVTLVPGAVLSTVKISTAQLIGAAGNGLNIFTDQDTNNAGVQTYTLRGGNVFCRPNTAPTAVLTGMPMSGAPPLLVHFGGAGSTDPDTDPPADTIASYTFNFGYGSAPLP